MLFSRLLTTAIGLCALHANAQSTLDASGCLKDSGVTTFAACNSLYSQITYCAGSQVATGSAFVSCYCNQPLFNGFYSCQDEQNRCFGTSKTDADYASAISVWHSACDKKITFTPTTPTFASLTKTFDEDFCVSQVPAACVYGQSALSQCSQSYHASTSLWSSCMCQSKQIAYEYTCGYIGNVSCLGRPGVLSALPLYTFCHEATSIIMALNATTTATSSAASISSSTSSITSSGSSSASITKPALPGSSSTTAGPASTSSSTGSANTVKIPSSIVGIAVGLIVTWQLGLIIN